MRCRLESAYEARKVIEAHAEELSAAHTAQKTFTFASSCYSLFRQSFGRCRSPRRTSWRSDSCLCTEESPFLLVRAAVWR